MPNKITISFKFNLNYQQNALKSISDLYEGRNLDWKKSYISYLCHRSNHHHLKTILAIILIFFNLRGFSSEKDSLSSNRGKAYVYWGYNRAYFSKSNIHVHGPEYDFTLYDVTAADRPSAFDPKVYFNPVKWTIPQFNIRLGYFLTEHFSISLGYDHMKYVVRKDQTVRMSGVVSSNASDKYKGSYLNTPVVLTQDFFTFEHSDGLNLVSLDTEYSFFVYRTRNRVFSTEFTSGIGGIWVAPRTDVRLFGKGSNNDYHVAGYSLHGKAGLRFNFFSNYFLLAQSRAGYMSLPSILIEIGQPQRADQTFYFWEYFITVGAKINLKKK